MTDNQENLEAVVHHYGLPALLSVVDDIIENIRQGVLSVSLDKDPGKASFELYAERMKLEGAMALKRGLIHRIGLIKAKRTQS